MAKRHAFVSIVPISALKSDNVEALKKTIAEHLPVAPAMYADGELTESSLEFRIAEMIREKLTLELNQEVPYGVAVEVEQMAEADGQLTVGRFHLGGQGRAEADRDRCQGRALEACRAFGPHRSQ